MARYLILDGYNVIGALRRYSIPSTADLYESRELLVDDALKAAGWMGKQIIVVFDAAQNREPGRTELRAGGVVRVIYSGPKESADDVIERLVKSLKDACIVCTADFSLQRAVLAHGAARSAPREFEELLDELPAIARVSQKPFRARFSDQRSPEMLRSLEELRRGAEDS
jgi:predicted RNA-binding protein with PIN domain